MIILDSLMESQIQDKVQLQTQIDMDMQMLITFGPATERTEKEWENSLWMLDLSYQVYPVWVQGVWLRFILR